jgi:hypothetical protein
VRLYVRESEREFGGGGWREGGREGGREGEVGVGGGVGGGEHLQAQRDAVERSAKVVRHLCVCVTGPHFMAGFIRGVASKLVDGE